MRNILHLVLATVVVGACSHPPTFMRAAPEQPAPSDSLYWKAVTHLDAANQRASSDSALRFLDLYLANGTQQAHRLEALTLRRLARDAMQLARVEAALQARSAEPPRSNGEPSRRDEEALKEVQRLKDELAKANEELERIRKRLAAPKPPTG